MFWFNDVQLPCAHMVNHGTNLYVQCSVKKYIAFNNLRLLVILCFIISLKHLTMFWFNEVQLPCAHMVNHGTNLYVQCSVKKYIAFYNLRLSVKIHGQQMYPAKAYRTSRA